MVDSRTKGSIFPHIGTYSNTGHFLINTAQSLQRCTLKKALTHIRKVQYIFSYFLSVLRYSLWSFMFSVFVVAKKFEKTADLTEEWYGTKYSVKKIPSDMIKVCP